MRCHVVTTKSNHDIVSGRAARPAGRQPHCDRSARRPPRPVLHGARGGGRGGGDAREPRGARPSGPAAAGLHPGAQQVAGLRQSGRRAAVHACQPLTEPNRHSPPIRDPRFPSERTHTNGSRPSKRPTAPCPTGSLPCCSHPPVPKVVPLLGCFAPLFPQATPASFGCPRLSRRNIFLRFAPPQNCRRRGWHHHDHRTLSMSRRRSKFTSMYGKNILHNGAPHPPDRRTGKKRKKQPPTARGRGRDQSRDPAQTRPGSRPGPDATGVATGKFPVQPLFFALLLPFCAPNANRRAEFR
jgi:hypothetical protein